MKPVSLCCIRKRSVLFFRSVHNADVLCEQNTEYFRSVRKIAKRDYWLRRVRPSVLLWVCMEKIGSYWTHFYEI
jgi:hypothetical protein